MDAKKNILIVTVLAIVFGAPFCFAGETTITGTMSCVMPEMVEFQSPALASAQAPAIQAPQNNAAPVVSGASGNYVVQKDEKMIQTEETPGATKDIAGGNEATVYTVCAR